MKPRLSNLAESLMDVVTQTIIGKFQRHVEMESNKKLYLYPIQYIKTTKQTST